MTEPEPYVIIIQGRATDRVLRPLLDDFVIDHDEPGTTRLMGLVRDPAHLHGVVAYLTSVAAEIISVSKSHDQQPTTERP